MTFLAAALPAMGGAAAAGAAGAAGAATLSTGATALASAGTLLPMTGLSYLGMLNTGLSLASAGLSLFGGNAQADAMTQQMTMNARSLELQARDDEQEARLQELAGKREANDITESVLQTISSQRLAFSANGLDPSFGTAEAVQNTTRNIAEKQLSTTRTDAQLRALSRRRQAQERLLDRSNLIISGTSAAQTARLQGYGSALNTIGGTVMRRIERG